MGTPGTDTQSIQETTIESQDNGFEKRYKDTQAAYTKSQQELKALQAKVAVLEQIASPRLELDDNQQEELEKLKFSDPDKWRSQMNNLETAAQTKHNQAIIDASNAAMAQAEVGRRAQVLVEFNKSHGLNVTDEMLKYDVPPRITKQLEAGEVTFEQFLENVAAYIKAPKIIATQEAMGQPNLNTVGGGDTPSDAAVQQSTAATYSKAIF